MTFQEAIARYEPFRPNFALVEPWISGGTTAGGLVVDHSEDLPCVYAIIHRLPTGYSGSLHPGDMVVMPRYSYESVAVGADLDGGRWSLAIMDTDDIEAVVEWD